MPSPIEEGSEVVIALASDASMDAVCTVARLGEDFLTVAAHEKTLVLKPGISVSIRKSDSELPSAWGQIAEIVRSPSGVVIRVTAMRWESGTEQRAERFPVEFRLAAATLSDFSDHSKKTIGYTIDVSLTGLRVRLRAPLDEGTTFQVSLHMGEGEPLEAIAKVSRPIPGSEGEHGSYEVGAEFVRFISGFGEFAKRFSKPEEGAEGPAKQEPDFAEPAA